MQTGNGTESKKGGRKRTGSLVEKGGSFYLVVSERDPMTGKRKRIWLATGATNKRKAEAKAKELFEPFAARDVVDRLAHISGQLDAAKANAAALEVANDTGLKLADAWIEYANAQNRPDTGAATMHQYELQFAAFEEWASKRKPPLTLMREVGDKEAGDFVSHLERANRTPNTSNKYLNLLQLVWRVLAKPARLAVNPWGDIRRKKLDPVARRELTLAELKTVCGAATGELATLLAVGLFTGMRLGDCCTLRWGETDIVRGIIRKATRKTGTAVQIPIHAELLAMLQMADENRAGEYVMPEYAAAYLKRNQTVVARIQKHFADCGIATAAPEHKQRTRRGVEVGFHSLRHSFVSLCAGAGVSLAAVQSIVGHSNPSMTRHYTHLGIEAARGAIAALPSMSEDATDTKPTPTPADALADRLAQVRELAETMTGDNWHAVRAAIMEAAAVKG
jgi:integrase